MKPNRRKSNVHFDDKNLKSNQKSHLRLSSAEKLNLNKFSFKRKDYDEFPKSKYKEKMDLDDIPINENSPSWMKLYKENFVAKPKKFHKEKTFQFLYDESESESETETDKKSEGEQTPIDNKYVSEEQEEEEIKHKIKWDQEKARKSSPYESGHYEKPYSMPPNELNFLGGLGEEIGYPRSKAIIERPTINQIIYNMRTRNNPVFTFCENPRKSNCCVKKKIKVDASNTGLIKHLVKKCYIADNQETPTPSEYSDVSTEIFDDENPTNMDFQGFDYKETYRLDEQDQQNRKEYFIQRRALEKIQTRKRIQEEFEDEERQKKYGLPDYFNLSKTFECEGSACPEQKSSIDLFKTETNSNDPILKRPAPDTVPYVPDNPVLAALIRTTDKPRNIFKMENTLEKQKQNLEERIKRKNQKENEIKKKEEEERKLNDENFITNLGEKDFEDYFKDDYQELLNKWKSLPAVYSKKKYPHTLRENLYLKRLLNRNKRKIREEAKIKMEFYSKLGVKKNIKEINLDVDSISNDAVELSEQSSEDDDGLSIGKKSVNKFQLRGFHYKLDQEPRGLINRKQLVPPVRGCITRNEWFKTLAPDTEPPIFFKNCASSIPSKAKPTDEDYVIFERSKFLPKTIEYSPIKEMIENPPGSPKIIDPKMVKIKKPVYMKVKKFNLTGYLYGTNKRLKEKKTKYGLGDNKYGIPFEMIEKCDALYNEKHNRKKEKRYKRMIRMGLPVPNFFGKKDIRESVEDQDEEYEDDDSGFDWLPENEEIGLESCQDSFSNYSEISNYRNNSYFANMRAPLFRQPTIRQHPRRKRYRSNNLLQFSKKNTFQYGANKNDKEDSDYYNIPRLSRIESDILISPNLSEEKKDFTDLFNSRHHHDHFDRTQHKSIHVKYTPKLPEFKTKVSAHKLIDSEVHYQNDNFHYVDEIKEEFNKTEHKPTCPKSSDRGNENYKEFLKNKNTEIKNIFYSSEVKPAAEFFEKEEYLKKLKDEEESIKSCCSSVTSSIGTNCTEDSGSYFLLQNKKVPFDYLRKSYVPFEEVDRSRLKTVPLTKMDEYYGPYFTVPFSGQKQEMRKITAPNDKFYTNLVRSRFGIRNRLQVILPTFDKELIGTKEHKFVSRLATEWDEYFQNEIKNRPRIRKFKPKTIIEQSRNAMRHKFQTFYMKEFISELEMKEKKQKEYAKNVVEFKNMCEPLFIQWEEQYYRSSMRKIQEFQAKNLSTNLLKKELIKLRKLKIKLNMEIIYIEDDWIGTIIYQNFHYLIHDMKWRQKYDWIHKLDNNELENYRESIKKRYTVNIRVRDKDDAWKVKEFYEQQYLKNYHEPMIIFPNTNSFKYGLIKLKMISFMCLLQLYYTMWILIKVEHDFEAFQLWSNNYILKRTKYVKNRCAKKYFMQNRSTDLQKFGHKMINVPIYETISSDTYTNLIPMCELIFDYFMPKHVRDEMIENSTIIDKFTCVSDLLINLLGKLDLIPREISRNCEIITRKNRAFKLRQAERACAKENSIVFVMDEMKRNLKPSVPKQRQQGKLPRSYLPPKIKKLPDKKVKISDEMKLYFSAFTDINEDEIEYQTEENMKLLTKLENNCIPFYFDHFLKLHDYFPVYDFKTKIELREGPEENRFFYKDDIENVFSALKTWELTKQKQMEYNIKRTWKLYID